MILLMIIYKVLRRGLVRDLLAHFSEKRKSTCVVSAHAYTLQVFRATRNLDFPSFSRNTDLSKSKSTNICDLFSENLGAVSRIKTSRLSLYLIKDQIISAQKRNAKACARKTRICGPKVQFEG